MLLYLFSETSVKNASIPKLILLLVVSGFVWASMSVYGQKPNAKEHETPNERFYRMGGRETKAQIVTKNGELTATEIAGTRDLRVYGNGGHFNCRSWIPAENDTGLKCDIPAIRTFIWEHWQNKRRGYIRITWDSVDFVSTAHIFIEPDAAGAWNIKWRWARISGEITDLPSIVLLTQKKPDRTEAAGPYVLVFKDREAQEVQRI